MRRHGLRSAYRNGCRCDPCTDAERDHHYARTLRLRERTAQNGGIAPVAQHNAATYVNWGCRCEVCTEANRLAQAKWRAARAAAS